MKKKRNNTKFKRVKRNTHKSVRRYQQYSNSKRVKRKILKYANAHLKKLYSKRTSQRHITHLKNHSKRILIFLGSGATYCFNGPSSVEILQLLKSNNKYKTTGDLPVGQFIYNKLAETYEDETNFESVIASIELIINYHLGLANNLQDPNLKSITPIFFELDETFMVQIDNFEIQDIPENQETVILKFFENDIETFLTLPRESAKLYYYSKILNNFLSIISISINGYSEGNEEYNLKLKQFIYYLISNNLQINFFTSNYDNLIPTIIDNGTIFNGFDITLTGEAGKLYNTNKILNDNSIIKHYNLHGSIFWHYEYLLEKLEYQYVFKEGEYNLPILSHTQITNPGEELVMSNIITGYNKSQRTLLQPFSLFMDTFIRECSKADILLIIGYSFSDKHINRILSIPFDYASPKIINITHSEDNFLQTKEGHRFTDILKNKDKLSDSLLDGNLISSRDNKQKIFITGFKDFLDNKANWKKIT